MSLFELFEETIEFAADAMVVIITHELSVLYDDHTVDGSFPGLAKEILPGCIDIGSSKI